MNNVSFKNSLIALWLLSVLLLPTCLAADYQSKVGLGWGTGNVTSDLVNEDTDNAAQESILFEHRLETNSSILVMYSRGEEERLPGPVCNSITKNR